MSDYYRDFVLLVLVAIVFVTARCQRLGSFHGDSHQVSVSGISSGACMATQFHVAHSSDVMGAGIVAGAPYMCAEGNVATALTCMQSPSLVSVGVLQGITASGALVWNLDSTSHMRGDRVWVFAGSQDSVIHPDAGKKVEQYYSHYLSPGNVRTVFNVPAEHSMPTNDFGGQCSHLNTSSYINNCHYNAAFEMLNFIYGGQLKTPVSADASSLLTFDQSEFFHLASPSVYSMDREGFVYVPASCRQHNSACKVHIAFHGCQMGRSRIGDVYARHAGYNEVAEANDVIVLYPQVTSSLTNLQGCWDWWGYTGPLYATKSGFQMTAVYRMLQRILN